MDYVTLGKTGITVNKNGFGALPIQRVSANEASRILQKAFDNGIIFFDTARFYTDSEEKIGTALSGVRDKIVIATKTMSAGVTGFWQQLETSLSFLKTGYIDIYQFHNPPLCPKPGDDTGLYEAMLEAKIQGKIRHIGITTHRLSIAFEAARSGLYETVQFPFSYLANDSEIQFVNECKKLNIGVIAMKALSGGLITNSKAAYAFLNQFDNVLPIWGIKRESELDEFITLQNNPVIFTDGIKRVIECDRAELGGEFCRGCGYCMPCSAGIEISNCARMSLLVRRAPQAIYLGSEWQEKMKLIENCSSCGQCATRCPYKLDTPRLLQDNLVDYRTFVDIT